MSRRPKREIANTVLVLAARGYQRAEICEAAGLSDDQVRYCLKKWFRHFAVRNRVELLGAALREGAISLADTARPYGAAVA